MIPQKQLTLADIFEDCKNIYDSDKPQFLTLLENHIDLDEIIPVSFYNRYYASTGRNRKYPLTAMLWALIIQRLFSIPTDSLLLVFLHYSRHLREFCGFTKVPDPSKITRFKQDFLPDLQSVFDNLVDITEPICQNIDNNLACLKDFTHSSSATDKACAFTLGSIIHNGCSIPNAIFDHIDGDNIIEVSCTFPFKIHIHNLPGTA